jgi:adenosylmethionine-8-amino-7-oxononanoate aminotransferase
MAARVHGAIVRPLGDTLVLNPPLAIARDELAELVAATGRAIDDVS